ncbi:glucosyltransferase domain-containing protein [Butyrivibrio sp. FCS006]|uniref:glucosyltransferase domain-containing protein n=1 Tax=Butyrivibrio sp. FCS006 TaxID=1280684 RepID=UPI00041E307C|nr:glucosyltransferase domain-containing protein [Butyrivibrio sp. FCS006]
MESTIKKSAKPIFIIWVISALCYLPLIARGLTNSVDGLWASTYSQAGNWELSIGRWAWLFLDKARGGYGAEPYNSLLTLLLIAIAMYIMTNMFVEEGAKPRYRFYIFAMIAMCSTTVCCYLSYRYMSPTFGMSVLLSVAASWFVSAETDNKKEANLYLVIATAFLIVSLGLYQANIGCFCVVIIFMMMKYLFQNDIKKIFSAFIRALLCGSIGCILYKIAWDVCLWARKVSPAGYNGANSLSVPHMILSLPKSLMRIYGYWTSYFLFRDGNYVFRPVRIVVTVLIFILLLWIGIKKFGKKPKYLALYLLLILLLPISADIFIILAPDAIGVLTQMTFPMMMVIPLSLIFLSGAGIKRDWLLCLFGTLLLYGNIYAVGTDIDAMAQGSNSSNTIMNNIVVTLNQKELVSNDYKYAFYGNISANVMFKKNELFDLASGYAKFGKMQKTPDIVHKSYIGLVDDLGVNLEIIDNDLYHEIYYSGVLDEMPAYPMDGAIVLKDGVVIVKVSDDYKVKK